MSHLQAKAVQNAQRKAIIVRWKISKYGATIGLEPLSDHAFRISGTTHLLVLGVDPFVFMVQRHWKSECLPGLLASLLYILPNMIGLAFGSTPPSSFLSNMAALRHNFGGHSSLISLVGKSGGPPLTVIPVELAYIMGSRRPHPTMHARAN